jgi:alpha/beta superfamily hydrolase
MSQIKPLRIGAPGQAMFAAYHPPANRHRKTAILLCNPVAHEATQTYRLRRVLADRLARTGRPVLRFDYRCTGDSDGACEDADVIGWKKDILAADRELRQLSGCQEVAWLGIRAGGNLAIAASLEASPEPIQVLILEGLTQPRQVEIGSHPEDVRSHTPKPADHPRLLFRLDPGTREFHGYPITRMLADQLSMLVKEQITRPPPRSLTWLSSVSPNEFPQMLCSEAVRLVTIEPWLNGAEDSFVATQAVPPSLLNALEAEIRELP